MVFKHDEYCLTDRSYLQLPTLQPKRTCELPVIYSSLVLTDWFASSQSLLGELQPRLEPTVLIPCRSQPSLVPAMIEGEEVKIMGSIESASCNVFARTCILQHEVLYNATEIGLNSILS